MANWGNLIGNIGNMIGYMNALERQQKQQQLEDAKTSRAILMQKRADEEYQRQLARRPKMEEFQALQDEILGARLKNMRADLQPAPAMGFTPPQIAAPTSQALGLAANVPGIPGVFGKMAGGIEAQIPDQITVDPGMTQGEMKAREQAKAVEMAKLKYLLDKQAMERQESDRQAARNFEYQKQLRGLPTYRQAHGGSSGSGRGGSSGGKSKESITNLTQTVPAGSILTLPLVGDIQSPFSTQKQIAKIHDNGKLNGRYIEMPTGDKFSEKDLIQFPDQEIQTLGLGPLIQRSPKIASLRRQYQAGKTKKEKLEKPSKYSKPIDQLTQDEKIDLAKEHETSSRLMLTTAPTWQDYYLEMQKKEGGSVPADEVREYAKKNYGGY